MDFNTCIVAGNLTRDPEAKTTNSGKTVVKMGLAINNKRGGGDNDVVFLNVEAWDKTAELCEKYLKKGSGALIEGRLKQSTWTDKEGNKRSEILLVANRVVFVPKSGGDQESREAGYASDAAHNEQGPPPRRSAPAAQNVDQDQDLPFDCHKG